MKAPEETLFPHAPSPALPRFAGEGEGEGEGRGRGVEATLKRLFGFDSFREGQREVVDAVLAGQDTLAVFPTGGGKSLLYQLPACLLSGATLVVSPLIALMKDQVDGLLERGVAAHVLNSSQDQDAQERVLADVAHGRVKLLFVAPERFRSRRFLSALSRVRIDLLAVDEAHCVSEWGHDFRPDYLRLGEAAQALGRPPILAVTATATKVVRDEIARSLGLAPDHRVLVRGFDRPNLRFEVVPASGEGEKETAITAAIAQHAGTGSVIVYCATRKNVEKLAARLSRVSGTQVLAYHAGMRPDARRAAQEAWSSGAARIVVATNAFGLGIDHEDVRLVVHHDLPGSVEAYYQEAGRAGRDGKPASCVLVFSAADIRLQQFLIEGSYPDRACTQSVWRELVKAGDEGLDAASIRDSLGARSGLKNAPSERAIGTSLKLLAAAGHAGRTNDWDVERYRAIEPVDESALDIDWPRLERLRDHEHEKLNQMLAYARGTGCRRAALVSYFGADPAPPCGVCDNCTIPAGESLPVDEAKTAVRKTLSLVARLKGRFGRGVVARLLAGRLKPEDADRFSHVPTVGALKPWSTEECESVVDACLAQGLLVTFVHDGKYPKLDLTPLGVEVLFDRKQVPLIVRRSRAKGSSGGASGKPSKKKREVSAETSGGGEVDAALLERLRTWRRGRAKEAGIPPYCVFHDAVLAAIATRKPGDLPALLAVSGVGDKKAEKYGEDLLAIVAAAKG